MDKNFAINYDYIEIIKSVIQCCSQHDFLFLTKNPKQYLRWGAFPDNCWVGVSVTSDEKYVEAIFHLGRIYANIKYISFEPLLGRISDTGAFMQAAGINWVIIGAQTKPTVLPEIEWVREIVEACDRAGVPVFLKNNMMPLMKPVYDQAGCIDNFFRGGDGITPVLRQELPIFHPACRKCQKRTK